MICRLTEVNLCGPLWVFLPPEETRRIKQGKETGFLRPKGAKRYQPGASPQVTDRKRNEP